MNIVDRCLETVAPHTCFVCGLEGALLCNSCSMEAFLPVPSRCYRCHVATTQSRVCANCYRVVSLSSVWVATRYAEHAKELIRRFKFERAKQAADIVARTIDQRLPILPDSVVVSHIPTANSRVRVRGYDQAELIARRLCRIRGWQFTSLLLRRGTGRQLGAKRSQRFMQLESAFTVRNQNLVTGAYVLLIDDVLTTGATVEAAARLLKDAGAKTIEAAVFAQP